MRVLSNSCNCKDHDALHTAAAPALRHASTALTAHNDDKVQHEHAPLQRHLPLIELTTAFANVLQDILANNAVQAGHHVHAASVSC